MEQIELFEVPRQVPTPMVEHELPDGLASPDLTSYDHVIVAMSGGKDSVACALHLMEMGIRPELWHHDVDGHADPFFDWPVTPAYCDAFAAAFDLPIFHSWRIGGLKRELLKENDRLAGVEYETPDGLRSGGGLRGTLSTRRRWPALGADLRTRWCSSVAKIDVAAIALAGQERFRGKRTLFVTGERAQESRSRANYATFENHRNHAPGPQARRVVHHWRPIHAWDEADVWALMARHRVNPHPCYHLGWSRGSCAMCIFSGKDHLATLRRILPERFAEFRRLEGEFGHTIRRGQTIDEMADAGTPFDVDGDAARIALSTTYDAPILVDAWRMPRGAFGENAGPT